MKDTPLKKYMLVLPSNLFDQVKQVADEECITVAGVLRKFIKLGLLVVNDGNCELKTKDGKLIKLIF